MTIFLKKTIRVFRGECCKIMQVVQKLPEKKSLMQEKENDCSTWPMKCWLNLIKNKMETLHCLKILTFWYNSAYEKKIQIIFLLVG